MNITVYSGGVIAWLLNSIITWLANIFGSASKFVCGFLFESMDQFLSADTNIVGQALHPLYVFATDTLIPIAFFILIIVMAYSLIKSMFGRFAYTAEDPLLLIGRTFFFGFLIFFSTYIMTFLLGPDISKDLWSSNEQISFSQTEYLQEEDEFVGLIPLFINSANASPKTRKEAAKEYKNSETKNRKQFIEFAKKSGNGEVAQKGLDKYDSGTEVSLDDGSSDTGFNNSDSYTNKMSIAQMMMASNPANEIFQVIWLLLYFVIYILLFLIVIFSAIGVCWKLVQRFTVLYCLVYMCPLALACGASKNTQPILTGWAKMVAAYGVTTMLTVGFMRVAQEIIYNSFVLSARTTNIFSTIFIYTIAIAFMNFIKSLERYVDRMGLNAVGVPDRSMLNSMIGFAVSQPLSRVFSDSIRQGLGSLKNGVLNRGEKIAQSKANSQLKEGIANGLDASQSSLKNGAFAINGEASMYAKLQDGNEMKQLKGHYDDNGSFIPERNSNGDYVATDGTTLNPDNTDFYTDMNDKNIQLEGTDDKVGSYAGVKDQKGYVNTDIKGDNYLAKTPRGENVLIPKSEVKTGTFYNADGSKWVASQSGTNAPRYLKTNDGNLVNVGNGTTYSQVKGEDIGKNSKPFDKVVTSGSDRTGRMYTDNSVLELDSAEQKAKNYFGNNYSFKNEGIYTNAGDYDSRGLYNGIKSVTDDNGVTRYFECSQELVDNFNSSEVSIAMHRNPSTDYLVRVNGGCVHEHLGKEIDATTL